MGKPRTFALVALLACSTGCFGYNKSAKRWAYAGDSVLILGGGGAIAADVLTTDPTCEGMGCPSFESPISGVLVAGVVLATAGLIGIILNATRPEVKTSR
jgi:hypothetical protein